MTARRITHFLTALAVVLAAVGGLRAQQPVNFLPTGTADWSVPTNWEDYSAGQNVPEGQYDESAVINSGGTAVVSSVFNDSTSPQGPGAISVGNGTLRIENTGELTLGEPAGGGLVDQSVTIGGTLNIQGAGTLNAASIAFQSGSVFDVDLTAGSVSPVNVAGGATLGGAIMLDYSALTNPSGSQTLITAGSVAGAFSSVATTGLGAAQDVRIDNNAGQVQATIRDLLSMTVDRDTGAVTINNTHASAISLDGYTIRSVSGSLNPAGLTGLGGGWATSAANSATGITQLYEGTLGAPASSIAGGASPSISAANLFAAATPTEFLQDVADLVFEYTDSTGTFTGPVSYVGDTKLHNNIVLTINDAGEAAILNMSPFPQEVEAYRITSSVNALQTGTWVSLSQQGIDDGTWRVSSLSGTDALLEAQEDGTTTFSSSTLYNIGQILNPGFSPAGMTFEYLLAGASELTTGVVEFDDLPVIGSQPGDYNDNGIVDAADYTVWRDNFGTTNVLPNDLIGGTIGEAQYNQWKSNFGSGSGSGSAAVAMATVPEPASVVLVASLLLGLGARRRIQPAVFAGATNRPPAGEQARN